MIYEKQPHRPPYGRATILSLLAIAYSLVLLPVALATDGILGPILVGTISFAFAVGAVWSRRTAGDTRPQAVELTVALGRALSFVSVIGLLWMVAYAGTYWPARGVISVIGDGGQGHAPAIARWVSLALASLISFSLAVGIVFILWADLYPDDAATAAMYRESVASRRLAIFLSTAGGLVVWTVSLVAIQAGGWSDYWYAVPVYALVVPAVFAPPRPATGATSRAIQRVKSQLETQRFRVLARPTTDSVDTAPLVERLHLLACRGDQAMAVQVRASRGPRQTVDWVAGTDVVIAARALNQSPEDLPEGVAFVEPMLVLSEAKPTPALVEFARQEEVLLVDITNWPPDDPSPWAFLEEEGTPAAAPGETAASGATS